MTGGYKFFSALPYIGSWDLMFQQQQPATGLSRGLEQGECEATRCCPRPPPPTPDLATVPLCLTPAHTPPHVTQTF